MKKNLQIYLFILFIIGIIMAGNNNITYGNSINSSMCKYEFKLLPKTITNRGPGASLILLNNGKVLITGGMIDNENSTNSVEIYDPNTNKFSKLSNMNIPRVNHASFLLKDGNVLIVGGQIYSKNKPVKNLKSSEIYDVKTNTFKIIENLNFTMGHPQIMRTKDDSIIIFCNENEIDIFDEDKYKFTPYKYNEVTKETNKTIIKALTLNNRNILFITTSGILKVFKNKNEKLEILHKPLPINLIGQSYEKLFDDKVLIIGSDERKETNSNNHYKASIFDIYNGKLVKSYKLNYPHDKFYTILLNDGNILTIGNGTWHYGTFITNHELSNKVEYFSINKNSFIKTNNRHSKGAVKMLKLNNGNILILSESRKPELFIVKDRRK